MDLSSNDTTTPEETEISNSLNETTKDSFHDERPNSGGSRPPSQTKHVDQSQSRSNTSLRTFRNTITTTKTELSYDNFEIEKLSAQIDKHSAQLKRSIMVVH